MAADSPLPTGSQINAFKKLHVLLPKEPIFLTLPLAALRISPFTLTIFLLNGPDFFALASSFSLFSKGTFIYCYAFDVISLSIGVHKYEIKSVM